MASDDLESYILLVLSDANLPTGSFVASAGLESHVAHALFYSEGPRDAMKATLSFVRDSVGTYARSALPFARDAQCVVMDFMAQQDTEPSKAIDVLMRLDALYESTALNHVVRRASRSQGVALLTLYAKGFTCPPFLTVPMDGEEDTMGMESRKRDERVGALVDALKLRVRREDTYGHLPVCWGVLAGALGLSLDRGSHLHLFLHARGVLSAAIRMNALGPYAAQQLLLHGVRPIVDEEAARAAHLTSGIDLSPSGNALEDDERLPASTWPLGEILAARHDLLHSRIFNS
ncbi:hypothetical protein BV25DRAFT_1807601 [Artomyces pyxidatus]|uniref:Uncharacterized protein n=1 Tax=Artomyces pyxidatus TaxID=48021 RepID=A0ACB8SUQ2_9AGAM|nr:hypothetical protein BV25DRAFT_1807601 [Artomyces pyxidatus]